MRLEENLKKNLEKKCFRTFSSSSSSEGDFGLGEDHSCDSNRWLKENAFKDLKEFRRTQFVDAWTQIPKNDALFEKAESARRTFDESALIALNFFVQEVMTSMLLPLASMHVARCRMLERCQNLSNADGSSHRVQLGRAATRFFGVDNKTVKNDSSNAYHDWTLPPTYSIYELVKCERIQDFKLCPNQKAKKKDEFLQKEKKCQKTLSKNDLNWCRLHGFRESFVKKNIDLFQLFLPRTD